MPAHRNPGPDDTELRRWFDEKLTQKRMAELATEKYNWPWKPNAIAVRLNRMGLTRRTLNRYDYTLPWTVSRDHSMDEVAVNLRRLGRRIDGAKLGPRDEERLERWLRGLDERGEVIAYDPADGWVRQNRDAVPLESLHPDGRVPIIPPGSKQAELAKRHNEDSTKP